MSRELPWELPEEYKPCNIRLTSRRYKTATYTMDRRETSKLIHLLNCMGPQLQNNIVYKSNLEQGRDLEKILVISSFDFYFYLIPSNVYQ